jgi:2-polyprenyl-3-methyl-5-hydroxy-6-metoxy-1,4-benzoquinol methylase
VRPTGARSSADTSTGGYSRPVHHEELSDANPRGGDINLRSGPQMQEYRAIARRISADRPERVLDWGCGYGQVADLLWQAGLDVTAFDYQPDIDAGVRPLERYPHLSIHTSPDPRQLPFAPGAFDAVLSCGVLEHVPDPDASLDEIRRVLTPGGTFYIFKLPNRTSYLEAIARRTGLYYHGACEHDRLYTRRTAISMLRRHDFEVREIKRMNMLPLSLTGDLAARAAVPIWTANLMLSQVPGLNLIATNLELVARPVPGSHIPPAPTASNGLDRNGPPSSRPIAAG